MVDGVRQRVKNLRDMRALVSAYYEPDVTGPDSTGPGRAGRQLRIGAGVRLVVGADGYVVYVERHERPVVVTDQGPVFMAAMPGGGRRRGHGGQGTRQPTSAAELVERAEQAGAVPTHTASGRPALRMPDGGMVIVPRGRDWHSLRNTAARLRQHGVDVSRG